MVPPQTAASWSEAGLGGDPFAALARWREQIGKEPIDPDNRFHLGGALKKLVEGDGEKFALWMAAEARNAKARRQ